MRRLFPSLSVKENLLTRARGRGWSLEKVYFMFYKRQICGKHKRNLLSGGEQQMVYITRAPLTNPDFLLMDKPSEELAPLIVREVGHTVSQLKSKGLSILLLEQNIPLALRVSDYAYVLYHGEIVHHCKANELDEDNKIQADYIGVAKRETK